MKKFAALVLALVLVLGCCAALAEGSIVKSYIYGVKEDTAEERFALNAYQLHLYDDGSYMMIKTTCSYGYSMQLGTAAVTTYGTYTQGEGEDGYMPVTLSEATRVIVNSYSKLGGFDIHIDTALTDFSAKPEMPAQQEGEKVFASSAADVIAAYGAGMTVYVATDDAVSAFTLVNPNE